MPTFKRNLNNIEIPNDDDLKIVDEFISSSEELKRTVNSLKKIFNKHFCFNEEEVKIFIYNICKDLEEKTIKDLNSLYIDFALNDVSGFDNMERQALARGIVNDTIDLYKSESRKISKGFSEVLEEASTKNIDPFKLAIKTNIETADPDKFREAIRALVEEKYLDMHTAEVKPLLENDEELKAMLEYCPSVACKANAQAVNEILNLLNSLFWDNEKHSYFYDVRTIIKRVPSILSTPPAQVKQTIEMLVNFYANGGKEKLLLRIIKSPSLLTINFDKVAEFDTKFSDVITKILSDSLSPQEAKKTARKVTDDIVMDITQLTQISKLKLNRLDATAQILSKYLGAENAISCMKNMAVLASEPALLECILATIVNEDNTTNSTLLREYFVKNPYNALSSMAARKVQIEKQEKDGEDIELEKKEREKIEVKHFPTLKISDEELALIQNRAGRRNQGTTQALLEKLNKLALEAKKFAQEEAERLQAEEEKRRKEEEERKAQIKEEIRQDRIRKREEEREKKRLAKQAAKARLSANEITPVIIKTEPQKELSLEEKQALRREKIAPIADIDKDLSVFDKYIAQYQPIFDAFAANGYYPSNLPRFSKIKEAIKLFESASVEAFELTRKTIEFSERLDYFMINEDGTGTIPDFMHIINENDFGKFFNRSREIFDSIVANNKKYSRAISTLRESYKKNEQAAKVFTTKVSSDDNLFTKYIAFKDSIADFTEAVEDEAERYFGKEYDQIFFPKKNEHAEDDLKTFIEKSDLNLSCYPALIYDIYCMPFHEVFLDEFRKADIITNESKLAKTSRSVKTEVISIDNNDKDQFMYNFKQKILPFDLVHEFLLFMQEEIDFLNKTNHHVFPNYNLQNDDFIVCFQSINYQGTKCYYSHTKIDNTGCHPGIKPPLYNYKNRIKNKDKEKLFIRCEFFENSSEFNKIFHAIDKKEIEESSIAPSDNKNSDESED